MGLVVDIVVMAFLAVVLGGGIAALYLGRFTHRKVRQVGQKIRGVLPERKAITMRPDQPASDADNELLAYPRKLEQLEHQLGDRIEAAAGQQRLVEARLSELKGKGGRQELTDRYQQDVELLKRRQESMRRVMGKVWKTRAILLLRVHLATTARRKPTFDNLPDPGSKPTVATLKRATGAFHEAASAVRYYLEEVTDRRALLTNVVPTPSMEAALDEEIREAVRQEALLTDRSYAQLLEQMDQLADNLTYLGDHYATVAVVAEGPAGVPEGSAAALLEQVEDSIEALDQLARMVDPTAVDAAVDNLSQDISRLEVAGQEVSAEAEASLEVENLLRR